MAVVIAFAGVLVGGSLGLCSGLFLQSRTDRRRMLGAGLIVAAELRVNAGEVDHFFLNEQLESEGSTSALSMPIKVETEAWRTHGMEVVHLVDDDLREMLLRLYAYLDRFKREPRLLRPNMGEHMRKAAGELDALAQKTWWDRNVLRI